MGYRGRHPEALERIHNFILACGVRRMGCELVLVRPVKVLHLSAAALRPTRLEGQ